MKSALIIGGGDRIGLEATRIAFEVGYLTRDFALSGVVECLCAHSPELIPQMEQLFAGNSRIRRKPRAGSK